MENRKLLEQQYIRLLPLQIMLVAMPAVNGMISGIYGSNLVSVEAALTGKDSIYEASCTCRPVC